MLDNHPVLKDRLHATAVFSGIAIAGVAGFDLVITGGFDFLTPGRAVREVAPSAYVTVLETPWSPQGRVIPLSSTEPLYAEDTVVLTSDQLAGGYDDEAAPQGQRYPERSQDDIYADIAVLFAETAATPSSYAVSEYEPAAEDEAKPSGPEPSVY